MLLVNDDGLTDNGLLGRGFEQNLADVTRSQVGGEVVERAVLGTLGTGAVGFATGGETLNERPTD